MGNGFGGTGPSQSFGNPGGLSGGRIASNLLTVASAYSTVGSGIGLGFGGESPISLPFFGGSLGDIIPRQKRHKRHPVHQNIIGTQVVSQTSAVPIAHIRYRTMDDAAIAVFDAAIAEKEVYGGIYGTPSSGYFATTPCVGESATQRRPHFQFHLTPYITHIPMIPCIARNTSSRRASTGCPAMSSCRPGIFTSTTRKPTVSQR